ncbi:uncharacterized protein LOC120452006 [Drosophila santomea]|uniref:uncharacterized protein LOC120452006 n=1 Tax=Drosophila santomea TaxID=129105 RepID=UPI001952EC28|nr:uncharacterized protein LOC120452006 [Drosophila santomea]XP_039491975.1 uncharacterized protein LOC120452006 [Drosophila santomea]XP_039491976.1 uncharacterized protein LOC120452006 [Drosophila santomea]XP_039491977.1 uncharacterized protein LOC120452006 [Drosophila santomea]
MTTAKSEKAEQQSKCNCTGVCVCGSEAAYLNQTCALALSDLNLKTFYCRQNERERKRERALSSAMILTTLATPPPLPPPRAFDDTQRSIKSSIPGKSPHPHVGQKVALDAPKKLPQTEVARKKSERCHYLHCRRDKLKQRTQDMAEELAHEHNGLRGSWSRTS